MSGIRLEVKVHIVTGAAVRGREHHQVRAPLRPGSRAADAAAAGLRLRGADRGREGTGRGLVDIGGGTTDIAIFTDGAIRHTAVIPIAGDQITNDIAMALRTPTKDAEDIKVESGCAKQLLADPDAAGRGAGPGRPRPAQAVAQALAGVIEPRVEEIFSLVQQVVRESGFEEVLSSGIVHHRRQRGDAGHGRAGRGHLPQAGAPRRAASTAARLADVVAQPRAATVMGLLEEARLARMRGLKVAQKNGSMKTAFGRFKDFIVGNF